MHRDLEAPPPPAFSEHEAPGATAAPTGRVPDALPAAAARELTPEHIRAVVRSGEPAYRACFEQALRCCPSLRSEVQARFVIGEHGEVTSVADAGSKDVVRSVVTCVLGAVSRLSFPARAGDPVVVSYPIIFGPGPLP